MEGINQNQIQVVLEHDAYRDELLVGGGKYCKITWSERVQGLSTGQ